MMRLPLGFLPGPAAQSPEIHYTWDDWNVEAVEEPLDKELYDRLCILTDRAIATFAAGAGAWVAHRFEVLSDDRLPWDFLEAAWISLVDPAYYNRQWGEFDPGDNWRGPVRGPLGRIIVDVEFSVDEAWGGGRPALAATWLSRLARHVLPSPEPFVDWQSEVLDRLATFRDADLGDRLGDVVPWEILDPAVPFSRADLESTVDRSLLVLRDSGNSLLFSSKQLLERGFEGVPFQFRLEADRARRRGGDSRG